MTSSDQFVDVQGVNTRFRERSGEDPALVLLHGIGQSLEFFGPQIKNGIGKNRLIAIDLPGHGLSALGDQPYDIEKFARFVLAFADLKNLGKFYCVGNSMGGAIAIRLAEQAPDRVAGIVPVGSAQLGREVFLPFRIMSLPVAGNLMSKPSEKVVSLQLNAIAYNPTAFNEEIRQAISRNTFREDAIPAFLSTLRGMVGIGGQRKEEIERNQAILRKLNTPVAFIHGKQDKVCISQHAINADAITPNSSLTLIDECGHAPQIEKPEVFNRAVSEFVARCRRLAKLGGSDPGLKDIPRRRSAQ